jgi:hypothetical protein
MNIEVDMARGTKGLIKVKLAHGVDRSLLLPDAVFAKGPAGLCWYQPKYFSACMLEFLDHQAFAQLDISFDNGSRSIVQFRRDSLERHMADGSALYRCEMLAGLEALGEPTGRARKEETGELSVRVFHHTTPETRRKIRECGYLLGSRWNIQGTRELTNVEYVYFTSVPKILDDNDLIKIAMASNGILQLCTTNACSERDVFSIPVYRESTWNRRANLNIWTPLEALAPQHIWFHRPAGEAAYYEVGNANILRVGIDPGSVLPIVRDRVDINRAALKRFEYVVVGNADTKAGLIAPYNEEDTESVLKIQSCGTKDPFELWWGQANSDVFGGLSPDYQLFGSDPQ